MKINRELLLNQLESVLPGLSPREIIEQSSCFAFQDGRVFTFNDEVSCQNECCLEATGAIQANTFISLLRRLKGDDIEIQIQEGEIRIRDGKKQAGLRMEQEVMLPISVVTLPKEWKDIPEDLITALQMVGECTSRQDTQFELSCIHLHPDFVEASDRYQAARFSLSTGIGKAVLIRRDNVKGIENIDIVQIGETKHWFHFKSSSGLIWSCRRYEEDFPDLSPVMKMEGEPVVLPKGLTEGIDTASIFSSENVQDDRIRVDLKGGKIRIKGQGSSGWYREIRSVKYTGPDVSFSISPSLFKELLSKDNKARISDNKLMVETGKFVYVTALEKTG